LKVGGMVEDSPAMIPLCEPEIRGNEWRYIKDCLDTNWVSSVGGYVDRFETMMAHATGRAHAVATVNGTAALHIALLVAGVEPGDEVLLPTLTFIAPANAIRYAGAWPVFIDVDPATWQLDPQKLADFLTLGCFAKNGRLYNRATDRRIAGILPVHILGHPVDMDPIMDQARCYGLSVVEDATESLGARYKGRACGGIGDAACFSFNGNKLITTGGGGMLVTDNETWAVKARHLVTQAKSDQVEYIHDEIGYNYRLSNIQAAMGVAQMELLDEYIAAKKKIRELYRNGLEVALGIDLAPAADWADSVYWINTIAVDASKFGMGSRDLMRRMAGERIQTRPLWHPVHGLSPYVECTACITGVADGLYRDCLSLPSSVGLKPGDQVRVIEAIMRAVNN
jgi:perosamine synthetase